MLHEGARDRNCFDFIRQDKIRDISERRLIKILASQGESMSILSLTELVMKSFSIAKKPPSVEWNICASLQVAVRRGQ